MKEDNAGVEALNVSKPYASNRAFWGDLPRQHVRRVVLENHGWAEDRRHHLHRDGFVQKIERRRRAERMSTFGALLGVAPEDGDHVARFSSEGP
jgi:hypothetical protein